VTHVGVMGVAGSGKSTVGRLLADALGRRFIDGDDLHPPANIAKMSSGVPLTDADRAPWLEAIAAELARGGPAVIACSALKRAYRERLPGVRWFHLRVPRDVLAARLSERSGHFFPPALLDSQLAELEEPEESVDGTLPPQRIAAAIGSATSS
jgi:gluconokinase